MELLLLSIPLLLIISTVLIGLSSNALNKFYSGVISTSLVFFALILSLVVLFSIYTSENELYYDNFYDWHFLNMELDDDYQDIIPSEKGDVFIAINKCIDVLESDSVSDSEKSFYLKLLVHFVGDLHQPLHIGRYEDRGANRVYVKWFGRNSNLHRVWDSDMINSHNMSYSELAVNLPNPDFLVFTDEAKDFERADVLDWVNEIHVYTNQIYAGVSVDDKLGYEYQYKNFGTVEELLLIGGIRLAKILNYLFD